MNNFVPSSVAACAESTTLNLQEALAPSFQDGGGLASLFEPVLDQDLFLPLAQSTQQLQGGNVEEGGCPFPPPPLPRRYWTSWMTHKQASRP
jgi:hypothetical protein